MPKTFKTYNIDGRLVQCSQEKHIEMYEEATSSHYGFSSLNGIKPVDQPAYSNSLGIYDILLEGFMANGWAYDPGDGYITITHTPQEFKPLLESLGY